MKIVIVGLPDAAIEESIAIGIEADLRYEMLLRRQSKVVPVKVSLLPRSSLDRVSPNTGAEVFCSGIPRGIPPSQVFQVVADNLEAFALSHDVHIALEEGMESLQ